MITIFKQKSSKRFWFPNNLTKTFESNDFFSLNYTTRFNGNFLKKGSTGFLKIYMLVLDIVYFQNRKKPLVSLFKRPSLKWAGWLIDWFLDLVRWNEIVKYLTEQHSSLERDCLRWIQLFMHSFFFHSFIRLFILSFFH